jgi:2-hydroxychromene-2-carboxylate isomerase
MKMPLRFLFDYISPYAYLCWTQIGELARRHGRAVEPVPVLFAGLLSAHGTLGPAEVPAKRVYLFKDVARSAKRLGVPIQLPFAHPFNPLLPLRLTALDWSNQQAVRLVDRIFAATWAERRDVTDAVVLSELLRECGLEAERTLRLADPEVKARVRDNTDRAIAEGVFGVPSILVDGEYFWGLDSLANIEQRLRGEDPVSSSWQEMIDRLPAAAQRSRR